MPDEALENALDRFDVEYLAAHGTMTDALCALKEHKEWIRTARRQLAEAKPYMEALRKRHNGYNPDPDYRKAMPDLKEPATPEQALDELIEEANAQGVTEGRMELAEAKAALSQAQLARHQASDLAARWGREILRLKDELWNQQGVHEVAIAEAKAARETAEAACAAIVPKLARAWLRHCAGWAFCRFCLGEEVLWSDRKLFRHQSHCIVVASNPGQALRDEHRRYGDALREIQKLANNVSCFESADAPGRRYRRAVAIAQAALNEKEQTDAD